MKPQFPVLAKADSGHPLDGSFLYIATNANKSGLLVHSQSLLMSSNVYHCMLYMYYCLFGMFTILDYSSALEYSIIRRYTNIVYYYYYIISTRYSTWKYMPPTLAHLTSSTQHIFVFDKIMNAIFSNSPQ